MNCPNCNAEIKKSMMSSNALLSPSSVAIINEVNGTSISGYCQKCSPNEAAKASVELTRRMKSYKKDALLHLAQMPIASINNPTNWNYTVIGFATAQSVTGTGVFSEFSMTINDLFGTESNTMNQKIKSAEDTCLANIRKKAWDIGGNAVLGIDIDYSEVGSLRGMMMVCISGTIVKVENASEVFCEKVNVALAELSNCETEMKKKRDILAAYTANL